MGWCIAAKDVLAVQAVAACLMIFENTRQCKRGAVPGTPREQCVQIPDGAHRIHGRRRAASVRADGIGHRRGG